MMRDLYRVLPDDRPITAICIVDDLQKAPAGYTIVSKTYDQDTDADLWKDGLFSRRITRYLCTSKTEGTPNYVVEKLSIINEKDPPPEGYTLITHTQDTEQRAWKKRQLCYKLMPQDSATSVITDVIILSRSKRAPDGFLPAGEINGLLVCFKQRVPNSVRPSPDLSPYSNSAPGTPTHSRSPISPSTAGAAAGMYPSLIEGYDSSRGRSGSLGNGGGGIYQNQPPLPRRAAPLPPVCSNGGYSTGTLGGQYGLDGVPFDLNSKLRSAEGLKMFQLPVVVLKTAVELDGEYQYDFRIEQETCQNLLLQE